MNIYEAIVKLTCNCWDDYWVESKGLMIIDNPNFRLNNDRWEFVEINLETKLVECYYHDDIENDYKIGTTYTLQDLGINFSYNLE